jgi:hypothetical protein
MNVVCLFDRHDMPYHFMFTNKRNKCEIKILNIALGSLKSSLMIFDK